MTPSRPDLRKWTAGISGPFVLAVLAYLLAVLIYGITAETLDKGRLSWGWVLLMLSAIAVGAGYGVLRRVLDPLFNSLFNVGEYCRADLVVGLIHAGILLLIVWGFGIGPKTLVVMYGVVLIGLGAAYRLGRVESWIDSSVMPLVVSLARRLYERPSKSLWVGFAVAFLSSAVADYAEQRVWAEVLSEAAFLMLVTCALIEIVRILRESWSQDEPGT